MMVYLKDFLVLIAGFWGRRYIRRLLYLFLLAGLAAADFAASGQARRTFVFYALDGGGEAVEERMLKGSSSRELDLTRYVEEVLLGPVSPELSPLFSRDTRLTSLLYREGVVYADLSLPAALGVPGGGDAFRNLYTLNRGIRRNFPFVRDVRLFIGGNEAFVKKFRTLWRTIAMN
jgi:hypothetical protein